MPASYSIGHVLGIPVKVHITLLIFLPFIAVQLGTAMGVTSLFWGLIAAAGLFGSVALHELGHSVVALHKGIRVREIMLLPIGGLAKLERMPRNATDEIHIAIAGPAVSFMLAIFFGALAALFGGPQSGLIIFTFVVLGWVNLVLALFNLLPSFPMDGGRILRAWLSPRIGRVAATRVAAKLGRYMAIAFGIWGLLPPFSFLTIAVAIFVYMAAGAEYRMVLWQENMQNPFGSFVEPNDESETADDENVVVSPPPYAPQRSGPGKWWDVTTQRLQNILSRWSKGGM